MGLKKWPTSMTMDAQGYTTVDDPVDAGFEAPDEHYRSYFWKRWRGFIEDFRSGKNLDFSFMNASPSRSELIMEPFFHEYVEEQKANLPNFCSPEVISKDKNGKPIAAVCKCMTMKGPVAKKVRHMCLPAATLARQYSEATRGYVLPQTAKSEALNH